MQKLELFCGINSYGLPFPRENKNHVGYYDVAKRKLEEVHFQVEGVNISSLNKNCTWDFQKIFQENYSIGKIKKIQIASIDELRNANLLFKLIIPKHYKDNFLIADPDERKTVKQIYDNSENPEFIYSAGINDVFSYVRGGPVEFIQPKVRNFLEENMTEVVDRAITGVSQNIELLKSMKKNVNIYVLESFYASVFTWINTFIKLADRTGNYSGNIIENLINVYNSELRQRLLDYENVEVIDTGFLKDYTAPFDFHPNTKGNEILGQLLADRILKKRKTLKISKKYLLITFK